MAKSHLVLILLLLIHLFLLLNLRFEAWPEMLLYPYLSLHGFLQYRDIIHPYPPLTVWVLSGYFKITDISILALQALTWTIILIIDSLVFYIARKKYGTFPALIALIFFVLWQPLLDGNGLWFDLMLTPILLLAFYRQSPALLSIAFFFKQTALWLFPLFLGQWKKLLVSLTVIFLITLIPFIYYNSLSNYLFWALRFPFTIFPHMPGHRGFGNWHLWIIGITPLILPIAIKLISSKRLPKIVPTEPLWWMILSIPFIFPRFGLFHFQPALAFAAIVLAQHIKKAKLVPLILIPYSIFISLLWFRQVKYFWHQPPRFFEPQIVAAAQKLRQSTSADQRLLFINAPEQLLILAQRLPTQPWADTFPWYLEVPRLQSEIIANATNQREHGIVFIPYQDQGQFTPGSYIPAQIDQYRQQFTQQISLGENMYLLKNLRYEAP